MSEAAVRKAVFPVAPLAAFVALTTGFLLIALVPPRLAADPLGGGKDAPEWWGFSFCGECLVTARLIAPASEEGKSLARELPAGSLAIMVRLDNSRGNRPVSFDLRRQRFFTFNGRSFPSLSLTENDSAAALTLDPGEAPVNFPCVFRSDYLNDRVRALYMVQVKLNDEIFNIPGNIYRNSAEYRAVRQDFEGRVKFFPGQEK